ncbi:P-loop containing nucleoside triphosphate hydrolase protein [Mycena floridula]|nr:P-loop containing nucleoside triphosphate hydrolase protein [Mycena floridula]
MPHQPLPQGSSKVEQIAQSGRNSARILKDIADTTKSSYLQGLAGITSMIFETIENVKSNKEKCLIMTEQVYELICAVINCCEDAIKLAPAFLHSILILTSTFQKVVSFMRDHTGGSLVKRLLHHPQAAILMEDCISSLEHALTLFKVQSNIMTAARMAEMQTIATKRHQELLDIINQPSELDMLHELRQSSSSVSVLLPAAPKIFHGRQHELEHIINVLTLNDTAQVAILGPGGIGKTSLAHATLHHSQIIDKFGPCCYWIACDSSKSASDLIVMISTHFGINGQNRLHAILTCIREMARPVLLILDNLETPWEQRGKQREVEDMLSHLTGLDNLSVVVTMRGSERPAQIQWTRPFLPPLGPISTDAARQTFLDISDADEEDPQVGELLSFTDNMPLMVSLLASIAGSEGCATTLTRWMSETTSLLSDGVNKQSNMAKSIEISLHSARFKSVPNAQHLLSILSYLPDGITLVEFDQIHLSFSDFSHCRSTLQRTSLAYITADDRFKLLAPVKEYIQKMYPPPAASIISIRTYFFDMIKLAEEIYKTAALLHKFTSNIGNIQFTLRMALIDPDLATIRPVLDLLFGLSHLYYVANIGSFDLIQSCFKIIEALPDNSQLLGHYYMTIYWTIPHHETRRAEAMSIEKAYEIQDSSCIAWGFYRLAVAQKELD